MRLRTRSDDILRHRIEYERLLPWRDQFGTTHTSVYGGVAHYLGLLAHTLDRDEEAERWFGQALSVHEALKAPFFVALTQTAWASFSSPETSPETQTGREPSHAPPYLSQEREGTGTSNATRARCSNASSSSPDGASPPSSVRI